MPPMNSDPNAYLKSAAGIIALLCSIGFIVWSLSKITGLSMSVTALCLWLAFLMTLSLDPAFDRKRRSNRRDAASSDPRSPLA